MSTLYKRIVDLCENKGIKPGRMCVDLCLSKSLMTKLRDNENKTITAETAEKIANYFSDRRIYTTAVPASAEQIAQQSKTDARRADDASGHGRIGLAVACVFHSVSLQKM